MLAAQSRLARFCSCGCLGFGAALREFVCTAFSRSAVGIPSGWQTSVILQLHHLTCDPTSQKPGQLDKKNRKDGYTAFGYYHKAGILQLIAKSVYFENTTLAVIVDIAIWITVVSNRTLLDAEWPFVFAVVFADVLFFSYFVMELSVRLMAFWRTISTA